MNRAAPLLALLSAARRRRVAIAAGLLLSMLLGWVITRYVPTQPVVLLALAILLSLIMLVALWWARRLDQHWLARRLDAHCPELQDSSALLLGLEPAQSPLAELQRERLRELVPTLNRPDLRQRWPWRTYLAVGGLSVALGLAVTYWPSAAPAHAIDPPGSDPVVGESTKTTLSGQLSVRPPAYTGLEESVQEGLEARVPEASMLRWALRVQPQPDAVILRFHDRSELVLGLNDDGVWVGGKTINEATFYRIVLSNVSPLAEQRSWRIEVIADQPPQIKVIQPERNLTVLERQQSHWPLRFEVTDDYGLGAAQLTVTLAQGSGELVEVSERTLNLRGEGDARSRSFEHRLQLGAYGFARGDDLIVRLTVRDNHQPQPQLSRSASYILRWPAELSADVGEIEGVVQRVMPTWFRSQRQIIIDTEALLEERGRLSRDEFVSESNEIGISQHALRLRYGQFLGEESEEVAAETGEDEEHHQGDGHDHPGEAQLPAAPEVFGSATNVLEDYGHTHDYAEATTLFDPKTRALLKAALDQMWRAEEQLRTAAPQAALPFEYAALRYIKQAQQATRIYLARVGLELPPIDFSRRLSGDTRDLARPVDSLSALDSADPVGTVWRSLNPVDNAPLAVDMAALDALDAWIAEQAGQLDDGLGLLALSDELRLDPGCEDCAVRLRQRLWPLLPVPLAAPFPRAVGGAAGQAYLRALGNRGQP